MLTSPNPGENPEMCGSEARQGHRARGDEQGIAGGYC